MVKYTLEYCKENEIVILTPTKEIFKKVTKFCKVSSKLRDYNWEYYKENTYILFLKKFVGNIYGPCFGDIRSPYYKNNSINYKRFFIDNNINNEIYELW